MLAFKRTSNRPPPPHLCRRLPEGAAYRLPPPLPPDPAEGRVPAPPVGHLCNPLPTASPPLPLDPVEGRVPPPPVDRHLLPCVVSCRLPSRQIRRRGGCHYCPSTAASPPAAAALRPLPPL
uniref:Uncharacterized protein n=1 Tax=Oryza nivara TaxID=4536 RepID=A0A0E0J8P6_ORYNI